MGARDDGSTSRLSEIESDSRPCWVKQMESKAKEKESSKKKETEKHSIYKLPNGIVRDKQRELYEPQVVSLGPYHHGKEHLRAMEEHKETALCRVHSRTGKSVEEYWRALKEEDVLKQLMDAYKGLDQQWEGDHEGFVKLMVLDGCFMLEVMRFFCTPPFNGYVADDPIFSYNGMLSNLHRIKRDMLVLENQIPLLVLHKLSAVEKGLIREREINKMVIDFFQKEETLEDEVTRPEVTGLHVLDVVRKSMIKRGKILGGRSLDIQEESYDISRSATQLEDAGIRFKRSRSLKDITFHIGFLHATLSLPQLIVEDDTESKFLNLMAFEHLCTSSGKEVSSYVFFMNELIKSDKDVSLLSENNIINNLVGTDKAVVDLFNRISPDVLIDPCSDPGRVYIAVIQYCNDRFSKYRASKYLVDLNRSYFRSPWTFISLMAAILLLSLTIIQSVYTILQYYKPH